MAGGQHELAVSVHLRGLKIITMNICDLAKTVAVHGMSQRVTEMMQPK